MKKTLLSLFALAAVSAATAQESIYDVHFIATGDVADETTVSVTGGTFAGTLRSEKTGLIVTQSVYKVDDVAVPVFKMQGGDETFVCTPTNGLKAGDVITVTGFLSSGDEAKSATVKISYDDTESYSFVTGYDEATFKGFTDLKNGGSGYNPGTEPNTAVFVVENDAKKFSLKRNSAGSSGGASSAFIVSVVVTRGGSAETPEAPETPDTPIVPDDSPISDIQIEASVVAVEYYTLTGSKVDAPVKGLNIVKTFYSDNTTSIRTIVK